ncbi:MAG TPA: hypothetical protein VFK35_12925 [Candidatus Limnocylindrales bacterium]|nr:hypothetical protein [Candidatus Limnocylindrales bacterium]
MDTPPVANAPVPSADASDDGAPRGLPEGSIERIAADWLAAEEELARGSGNPTQSEITARELSARYDEAIHAAGREDLRLAWEAARQWQAEQVMGSEAWAGARRLSELLRGEYLAMDPGDGTATASRD